MNLLELKEGAEITITVFYEKNQIEFKSKVVGKLANTILIDELLTENNTPVSLKSEKLYIELTSLNEKNNPIVWKNVIIRHITLNGAEYHRVAQTEDGKTTNRRAAYRLSVLKPAIVQIDINSKGVEVICRDISVTGFSFLSKDDYDFTSKMQTRLNLTFDDKSISLTGTPIRKQKVKNSDKYIYACKIENYNSNLDKFIMEKQREQMRNKLK